jgi:hypothetical protein
MDKLRAIVLCILCLAVSGIITSSVVFSQNTAEPIIKESSGKILSVDALNSTLIVRFSNDMVGEAYSDVKLIVTDDTIITGQNSSLAISDLKPSERVDVIYETGGDGSNTVKSIMVGQYEQY